MLLCTMRSFSLLIIFVAGVFMLAVHTGASAQPLTGERLAASQAASRARLQKYFAWMNSPWRGDDAPYQAMRARADQALANGQSPVDVLKTYEDQLATDPKNSLAFFGRTYAAYRLATWRGNVDKLQAQIIVGGLYLVIVRDETALPHTYNCARLAFLCGSLDGKLAALGARLLQQNPNDLDVEYAYANDLNFPLKNPVDRAQAIVDAADLVKRYPNDPRSYILLARIAYNNAFPSHDQAGMDKCIAYYQQALSLEPANSQDSASLEATIKGIQMIKERWKAGQSGG